MDRLKYILLYPFVFILLFLCASSCSKNDPNEFTIKGAIDNLSSKKILFVRDYPDSVIVDTIDVENKGSFEFKGVTDTLMLGTLYFNNGTSFTSVFINKGIKIKLEGDANLPDLIDVQGGDENEDLATFKKNNRQTLLTRAKLLDSVRKGIPKQSDTRPSKPNPDVISKISNLNFQLTNSASEYIKTNPEKIASVILIQDFFKDENTVDQLDKKLQLLKTPASKFSLAYQLRQYVNQIKASQEGAVAPYFSVKDTKNSETRSDSYRGKYLLISFSTSDCPICQKNKEDLTQINQKYKDNQVQILSLIVPENNTTKGKTKHGNQIFSTNTSKADWKIITLKEGWAAKILTDYNVNELPMNILISPTGKILGREESPTILQSKLPKLTNK